MKIIFIVGPQGSGKTTLARLIGGYGSLIIPSQLVDAYERVQITIKDNIKNNIIIDECCMSIGNCKNLLDKLPSDNDHLLIFCFQTIPFELVSLHYEPRPIIISLTKPASANKYREIFNCDISQMVGIKSQFIEPKFSPVNNPLEDKIPSYYCFTKKKQYSKADEILSSLDSLNSSAIDALRIGISWLSFLSFLNDGRDSLCRSVLILEDVIKSLSDAKNSLNPDSNEQPQKSI